MFERPLKGTFKEIFKSFYLLKEVEAQNLLQFEDNLDLQGKTPEGLFTTRFVPFEEAHVKSFDSRRAGEICQKIDLSRKDHKNVATFFE